MTLNSIRTKIIGGYILFVVLILAFLSLNYWLVTSAVNKIDGVYQSSEWVRSEMETENVFWRQVIAMTEYFLTGEEAHNAEFHNYQNTILTQIGILESSIKGKDEREALGQLRSQYELFVTKFDKAVTLYRAGRREEARQIDLDEMDPLEHQLEKSWEKIAALRGAEIDDAVKAIRAYKKYAAISPSLSTMIEDTEAIYKDNQALEHSLEAEEHFLKQIIALTDLFVFNEREHIDEFHELGKMFDDEWHNGKLFTERSDEDEMMLLIDTRHRAFTDAFNETARIYDSGDRARALRAEIDKVDPAEDALAQALGRFYPLKQQDMKRSLDNVRLVDTTALSITKTLGLYLFLTLIIGLIIGAISAIRITKPVKRLVKATQSIAAGDFSARLEVKSGDEIGQLSRSFNSMAENLQGTTVSKDYVDGILRSMSDSLVVASSDGRIVTVNAATCRMLGHTEEEIIGQPLEMLFAQDGEPQSNDLGGAGMTSDVERIYLAKDGRSIPISFSSAALHLDSSQAQGTVCMAKDITERKREEAALQEARDEAVESARLKSEFLANMSHEIRTPMNGVIGMTGLLLDTTLTAEQREFAETIRSSGDSLLTIINDILDFSKIEAGKLQFEILDFNLSHAVEGTVELLAERAHDKQVELASLVYSDVPTELRGDPGRLRQVLTNLIGNALKFTESGEVIVRAEKASETAETVVVRFSVSDTGIGISEAAQRHLFQAFTQADGSTTRKYGGTGLGLAISKQLVELMQGEIGVESVVGKGSTFWFTARFDKQPAETHLVAPTELPRLDQLRALIVDDNATNRKILSHQLSSWGMVHAEADCGARALELLRAAAAQGTPFDLAILDLMMPGMDGFELARAIKAEARIGGACLVMLTSFGQRGQGATAREAGVAAYLTKPVRQSQLFDCLVNVVGQTTVAGAASQTPTKLITRHSLTELKSTVKEITKMSPKLILLAEDNIVNQKVATRQLQKLGYRADAVANGREAVEALQRIAYDLVLMDCQMPEMDGYEATAEIRRREGQSKHTLIVAMTANALEGDRAKCLAAGMDDYVSKPVKPEELGSVLERLLAEPTASRESEHSETAKATSPALTPPVDMARLSLAMGDEPEELAEILGVYLEQMSESLKKLAIAIETGNAREVDLIGHNCAGVSANCGVVALVAPLRELERMGREHQLAGAATLSAQVSREFERVKRYLAEQLEEVAV